jgi:hypothetical protein
MKTAGDLIREALRAATITGTESPVSSKDFAMGQDHLNDILRNLQSDQIHMWSETEATIPMNQGQRAYVFGTDHAFTDYIYRTASAAVSGATVLNIGSNTGVTIGDNIGVELSTGVRQWTTVDSLSGINSVNLDAALLASVNDSATVYIYTTGIDQPVRILSLRYSDGETYSDIQTWQISRDEYYNLTDKSDTGSTNQWYFSRQLNAGVLNVWPTADNCKRLLRITFIKPQEIPADQSENVAIPPEWYLGLKFQLATDLGVTYAVDANRLMILEQKAAAYMQKARDADQEFTSFSFAPDNL